jgi:Tfp pilus assembly protein PilO
MTNKQSFFDKLNLRPQERRLVVIVGTVIFVLLNMWFVWPYFDDWGQTKAKIAGSRATLERYQREIDQKPKYEARLRELETTGSDMLANENELQRVVLMQAAAAGVQTSGSSVTKNSSGNTNQFFQEASISIPFHAGGKELVDFLVGIAAQNAMIRVRDMSIRPEQNQTRLGGTLVFVGNFQQRPPTNTPPRKVAAAPQPKK